MAPSVDSSRREVRAKQATADVGVDVGQTQEAEESVDVAAVVNQVMQSNLGNTVVQAALSGSDMGPLGEVIAGEIAAATAGMGAMSADGTAMAAAGNAALARVASSAGEGNMSQTQALNELRGGGGQVLPSGVQSRMEQAFGRSFANVRVHVGGRSAAATSALNAQAVALGSHIHFADGHFAPGSTAGEAVIAHELTHVVQAEEGRLPTTGGISDPMMAAEREAYGNETLASTLSSSVDLSTSLGEPSGVTFASSIETGIAPSALGLPTLGMGMGMGAGLGSIGGDLGMSGGAMAAAAPSLGMGAMSAAPAAAPASAPAMLREEPSRKEAMRQTDREASIQHELQMGLNMGFSRAVDQSQGEGTSNIPKEGTGRREGVFSGPSKSGHHAVNEYMDVMKKIGPDGRETRSASDDNIRAPAVHTFSQNDGHTHLDGSPKLGAEPEGANRRKPLPPPSPSSVKKGPFDGPVNAALEDAFGQDLSGIEVKTGDSSASELGARAYTKGKSISFAGGVDPNNGRDSKAMETVGHEVAHALQGARGPDAVDQPGDEGERSAADSGKKFAEFARRGGDAPKLGPAAGGKASAHRESDPAAAKKPARKGRNSGVVAKHSKSAKPEGKSSIKGLSNLQKQEALEGISGDKGDFGRLKQEHGADAAKELQQEYVGIVAKDSFKSNPGAAIEAAEAISDSKQRAETLAELHDELPEHRRADFGKAFGGLDREPDSDD